MTGKWYFVDKYRDKVEEREIVSHTAKFITPLPTGMWAKSTPRREAKGDVWYPTHEEAVHNLGDRLFNRLSRAKEALRHAQEDWEKFNAAYKTGAEVRP